MLTKPLMKRIPADALDVTLPVPCSLVSVLGAFGPAVHCPVLPDLHHARPSLLCHEIFPGQAQLIILASGTKGFLNNASSLAYQGQS